MATVAPQTCRKVTVDKKRDEKISFSIETQKDTSCEQQTQEVNFLFVFFKLDPLFTQYNFQNKNGLANENICIYSSVKPTSDIYAKLTHTFWKGLNFSNEDNVFQALELSSLLKSTTKLLAL